MEYKPILSDEELLALWAETPSARKLARLTGIAESTLRGRIRKLMGESPVLPDPDRHGKIEQLVQSIPKEAPGGGQIREARVTLYGSAAYNKKEEAWVKEGLNSTQARYVFPQSKVKPQWPPIQPYYEVEAKTYIPLPPVDSEFERTFIWGDTQAHFWRERGQLIPFHDEAAIDCGLQALARYRPHRIVILGDFFDLPGLGRFRKEPAFAYLMNAAIAYCTYLIAKMRSIAGDDCEIVFVPGNHEARLIIAILENLAELYGIKRPGDAFELLSIPYLLNFEKYNIKCVEQYPSGMVWLTDDLVCLHAPDKSIAATQICGHKVKATIESDTKHYRDGRRTYKTIIVPGFGDYHRSTSDAQRIQRTNIPSGVARSNAEQAFATVEITSDRRRHKVTTWEIENGECFFKDSFIRGTAEGWIYDEAA